MKRAGEWHQVHSISDTSSDSDSDSDSKDNQVTDPSKRVDGKPTNPNSKFSLPEVNPAKKRAGGMDFEALRRHGYSSGPSVLKVPPPREAEKDPDWSWSTGKDRSADKKENEESFEERVKTRAAISQGELLPTAHTSQEKKNLSFSQKEKRKRELGQASRGKSYVEEEKRLLRDSGVYSGFDT